MADEHHKSHECETNPTSTEVDKKERGLFDFIGKKEEEKPQEEVIVAGFDEKVKVEEEKPSLLEKLHRSHSSSSSSSSDEEEVEEGGEKKKKKKGLKEKLKEKIGGGDKEEKKKKEEHDDTYVPIEKCDDLTQVPPPVAPAPVVEYGIDGHDQEGEAKEKKGFFEKIKEKFPGYHKNGEEKKEESTAH